MPTTVTDNFNRADETPLGNTIGSPLAPNNNWTGVPGLQRPDLKTNIVWSPVTFHNFALYIGQQFTEDTTVQIDLVQGSYGNITTGHRMDRTKMTAYTWQLTRGPILNDTLAFLEWNDGSVRSLPSNTNSDYYDLGSPGITSGTLKSQCIQVGGNINLIGSWNGVVVTNITVPAVIFGGNPGFDIVGSTFAGGSYTHSTQPWGDNWSCTGELLPNPLDNEFIDP